MDTKKASYPDVLATWGGWHGKEPMKVIQRAKLEAKGREQSTLISLCNAHPDWFNGKGQPCPKCGGDDRFSWNEKTQSFICRKCFMKNPDIVGSVAWLLDIHGEDGQKQTEAAKQILKHLGIDPESKKSKEKKAFKAIRLGRFREPFAMMWASSNQPIEMSALKESGMVFGEWFDQQVAIFPIYGPKNKTKPFSNENSEIIAYNLYAMLQGGGRKSDSIKVRRGAENSYSRSITLNRYETEKANVGIMGPMERLAKAKVILKVEGMTDMLAANTLLPQEWCAVSNSCGSRATPPDWFVDLLKDRRVFVIHDADDAGEAGAKKWVNKLTKRGCKLVHWPRIADGNGNDLRDFLKHKNSEQFLSWLKNSTGELPDDAITDDEPAGAEDVDSEGDDILQLLGCEVLYEGDSSEITIYCSRTRKVVEIKKLSQFGKVEMVQAFGRVASGLVVSMDPNPR